MSASVSLFCPYTQITRSDAGRDSTLVTQAASKAVTRAAATDAEQVVGDLLRCPDQQVRAGEHLLRGQVLPGGQRLGGPAGGCR
jgi:hypothetical protein